MIKNVVLKRNTHNIIRKINNTLSSYTRFMWKFSTDIGQTYQMSEIRINDTTGFTYVTSNQNDYFGDEAPGCLVDGIVSWENKWCFSAENNVTYIIFDSSTPMSVTKWALCTGGDTGRCPERNPNTGGALYGTNSNTTDPDSQDWIKIGDQGILEAVNNTWFEFIIKQIQIYTPIRKIILPDPDDFKRFMWKFSTNIGQTYQMSEIKINDITGFTYIASNGNPFTDQTADKLVDGIESSDNKWCFIATSNETYIIFDSITSLSVTSWGLRTAEDTAWNPERNPTAGALYGTNSETINPGSQDWIKISDQGILEAVNNTWFIFTV